MRNEARRADAIALPHWPALMDTATAARYVTLGETTFRAWAARAGIRPVDLGCAVTRWRKSDLDAATDASPLRGDGGAGPDLASAQAEALRRIAAGGRRRRK